MRKNMRFCLTLENDCREWMLTKVGFDYWAI